ncbi:MAG: hypothetical protein Q8O15_10265 [Rectinemataceae bacterium]|nr:hypothetical protein [Rectinemataceae bacterium]
MAALTLALSCSGIQNSTMGTLALNLQCDTIFARSRAVPNGGQKPASIGPEEDWSPNLFTISGTGPGGATLSRDGPATAVEEKLRPGEWIIEVKAFSASGKEVAAGSSQCLLQPGRTTSAKIVLYPLDGVGNLSLTIAKNMEVPAGGRITGNLNFKGLPGKAAPQSPATIAIDIPAEQAALGFAGLGAGHYSLTLKLVGSNGVVSGGCAETILLVAGFLTSGVCTFEMGEPVIDLSAALYPASALPAPIISVEHSFTDNAMPLPLAISRYTPEGVETIQRRWYLNGEEAGAAVELIANRGLLPAGTFVLPRLPGPSPLSTMRIDFVEESLQAFRAGSASATLTTARSTNNSGFSWRASYDYKAAMGRSLGETTGALTNGTGTSYAIKGIATSPSGLVAILGLDEIGAVHGFAAAYGAELDPMASPGVDPLSIDASWIRLWRNRKYINSTYKNPDRIAVSKDGRFIAAALSNSNWIWLTRLDEGGLFAEDSFITSDLTGLVNMESIQSLCFSNDGEKIYVTAKAKNKIFAINVVETGLTKAWESELEAFNETSISLKDIKVSKTGSIITSVDTTSKLYIIQDDTSYNAPTYITGSSESGPYKPTAIAISEVGDAFYVLCNGDEILCFSRLDPSSPYTLESSFILPSEVQNANSIAVGKSPADGACETLAVAGGNGIGFFDMGADRTPNDEMVITDASCGQAGIDKANGFSYIRGAFILSGGTDAIVSVFGRD